jgi:hypothetical protein
MHHYTIGCEVWVCIGDPRELCKFARVAVCGSEMEADDAAAKLNTIAALASADLR